MPFLAIISNCKVYQNQMTQNFRDSQTILDGRNLCLAFITKYYMSPFAKDIFQIKPCEGRSSWKLSHTLYSTSFWENLSVRNFPLFPKTKWITLENLMQLNAFLEHEQENCRLVSQHRMVHKHHKANESYK